MGHLLTYLYNAAIGLDYLGSVLTGGVPGTTLSGRAGSAYLQGKLRGRIFAPIIDWIMRNPMHCQNAIQGDDIRALAVLKDQGGKLDGSVPLITGRGIKVTWTLPISPSSQHSTSNT